MKPYSINYCFFSQSTIKRQELATATDLMQTYYSVGLISEVKTEIFLYTLNEHNHIHLFSLRLDSFWMWVGSHKHDLQTMVLLQIVAGATWAETYRSYVVLTLNIMTLPGHIHDCTHMCEPLLKYVLNSTIFSYLGHSLDTCLMFLIHFCVYIACLRHLFTLIYIYQFFFVEKRPSKYSYVQN